MRAVLLAPAPACSIYDALKTLAVVLMIIDHIGYYFLPEHEWLRAVGRGAAPIWFFLVGYAGKTTVDWRLWLGAAIMLAADFWLLPPALLPVNILVTIIIIRFALALLPAKISAQFLVLALVVCTALMPVTYPYIEYGALGMMLALWGRCVRQQTAQSWWVGLFALVFLGVMQIDDFAFDWAHSAVMIGVLAAVYAVLQRFQPMPLAMPPVVAKVLHVGGRHSLVIYVAHLLLFAAIAKYILGAY